jgi:translation initiation factor IF-2
MLEPSYVEIVDGQAEVRDIFSSGKRGKVAGVYVSEGKVNMGVAARVRRGEQVLCESTVSSLRRFKDDIKEVTSGYECGVVIKDFNDFEAGDVLEFFRREKK